MGYPTDHLRLSDLNELVAELFDQAFPGPFWIVAEIASVSTPGSAGHTYLDLVEKRGDEVIAQSRANLWRTRRDVAIKFEKLTRRRLERGMQVLLLAQPTFHARYGYSLDIRDIDANYTLGDMARKRQEVIARLTDEGLVDRNRGLNFSPAPLRIAVVSSATAAGWEDFRIRLSQNVHGYSFTATLFAALMQGSGAERSIIAALRNIGSTAGEFDCVAILRGGGAMADLTCFDGFDLACVIAQFPLPVICGIGHERDTSVCDLVSHHAASTPTAAAELLISRVRLFEEELLTIAAAIRGSAVSLLARERQCAQHLALRVFETSQARVRLECDALHGLGVRAAHNVRLAVARRGAELAGLAARADILPGMHLREHASQIASFDRDLRLAAARAIERTDAELVGYEREVRASDPVEILKRGYSITRVNGRVVRDSEQVRPGMVLETTLNRGKLQSIVAETEAGD